MKSNRVVTAFWLLISCLTLAGCWDAQELSDTSIVLGIAIDAMGEEQQVTLELCPADSGEALILQAKGKNFEECVVKLQQLSEGALFWSGTSVLIYGDKASADQLNESGMYLYQSLGVSGKTPLLKVVNGQAAQVLQGSFGNSPYVSMGLGDSLRLKRKKQGPIRTLADQLELAWGENVERPVASVTVDEHGAVSLCWAG